MNRPKFQNLCNAIGDEIARLLPSVLQESEDWSIGQGNCVLCAMDSEGNTAMRIYGTDPVRQRRQGAASLAAALSSPLPAPVRSALAQFVLPKHEAAPWSGAIR